MRYLILFVLVLSGSSLFSQKNNEPKRYSEQEPAYEYAETLTIDSSVYYTDTVIRWMTIQEMEAAQKVLPKKVVVSVYATWCRWCRQEDSVVYRNKEVAHYINQHYYAVKFNAETRTPIIFKGNEYTFNKDENVFVHQLAQYLLNGKMQYPGIVFLDEKLSLIGTQSGYTEAPYLESLLNYYGSNAYRKMPFGNFDYEFEGKIKP